MDGMTYVRFLRSPFPFFLSPPKPSPHRDPLPTRMSKSCFLPFFPCLSDLAFLCFTLSPPTTMLSVSRLHPGLRLVPLLVAFPSLSLVFFSFVRWWTPQNPRVLVLLSLDQLASPLLFLKFRFLIDFSIFCYPPPNPFVLKCLFFPRTFFFRTP